MSTRTEHAQLVHRAEKVLDEVEKFIRGDMSSRRNQTIGPFSIYLETGRLEENGSFVMVDTDETIEPDSKEDRDVEPVFKRIKELEEEPFLVNIYFRKNVTTYSSEEQRKEHIRTQESLEKAVKEAEKENGAAAYLNSPNAVRYAAEHLCRFLYSWDLTDGEIPVPATVDGIIEYDVDIEIINACITRYYRAVNPPLDQTRK